MKTVRKASLQTSNMAYFGLEKRILIKIKGGLKPSGDGYQVIKQQFNIDGIPLLRSTNKSFWVISCRVVNSVNDSPFAVAIFCGSSKPKSAKKFRDTFIKELRKLTDEGILVDGNVMGIRTESFICDAPARSFVKGIVGHGGYSGCKRCCQRGVHF